MTVDVASLERLATLTKAATSIVTDVQPEDSFSLWNSFTQTTRQLSQAEAAYIAAASPDVVLGLIAEIRRLRKQVHGLLPHLLGDRYRSEEDPS